MPLFETDDVLYRVQGRWIDAGGKKMFVTARYVAWGIFLSIAVPAIIPMILVFGWVFGIVYTVLGAATAAWALSDFINGEYRVGSWRGIVVSEVRSQRKARRTRDRAKPYRITAPLISGK